MGGLNWLRDRLRGVRGIEVLALAAAASLLGLLLLGGGGIGGESDARTDLERRMEEVLSAIQGAGKVRVMISQRTEAVSAFAAGDGGNAAEVRGVLVVAEGAGDLRVRLELSEAVQALLGVETGNIEIAEMRRRQR